MGKRYKAVILDFFDTVVDFDWSKLPLVEIDGTRVNTTSRAVYDLFAERYPDYDYPVFHEAFIQTFREFEALKRRDMKEYPSRYRFLLLLQNLGIKCGTDIYEFADKLVAAHMSTLKMGVRFPAENRSVLEGLAGNYALGLLSNFDCAHTARSIIGELDIGKYFDSIIISADTEWRKPKRELFYMSARALGAGAEETIFVGDNFHDDIVGSKSAGMDAAWIKKPHAKGEIDETLPDYTISSLPEIMNYL